MACRTRIMFSRAACVRIRCGRRPSCTRPTILRPACLANHRRWAETAGAVAEPGRAKPAASARHCMVLAVPRRAQEPAVGHTASSKSARASGAEKIYKAVSETLKNPKEVTRDLNPQSEVGTKQFAEFIIQHIKSN